MPAKLVSRVPQIAAELPARMSAAEMVAAEHYAERARQNAPRLKVAIVYPSFRRDPGQLAASIEATQGGAMPGAVVRVGEYWGAYVEYGTRYMRAEPFLGPAEDYGRGEVVALGEEALQGL